MKASDKLGTMLNFQNCKETIIDHVEIPEQNPFHYEILQDSFCSQRPCRDWFYQARRQ